MPPKNPTRVLIVDDDTSLRELLGEIVEEWGYDVTVACNAAEAMEILSGKKFNIVLCDLKMPGMGGLKLLKKIKAHDKDICIIVITGYGTVDTAVKAIDAGAFDYLTKPFPLDDLKATMIKTSEVTVFSDKNSRALNKLEKNFGSLDVMQAIQRKRADEPG